MLYAVVNLKLNSVSYIHQKWLENKVYVFTPNYTDEVLEVWIPVSKEDYCRDFIKEAKEVINDIKKDKRNSG